MAPACKTSVGATVRRASALEVNKTKSCGRRASRHNARARLSKVSACGEAPAYGSLSEAGKTASASSHSVVPCKAQYQKPRSRSQLSRSRCAGTTTANCLPVSRCNAATASALAGAATMPLIEITRAPRLISSSTRRHSALSITVWSAPWSTDVVSAATVISQFQDT